jgi:hypothetical protein
MIINEMSLAQVPLSIHYRPPLFFQKLTNRRSELVLGIHKIGGAHRRNTSLDDPANLCLDMIFALVVTLPSHRPKSA